ncbi:MAG: hypothetical protein OXH06_18025 [Gemmatimonadetes bacterium]|nr:hypothetical protein [Gemmatimonadota bacterium]
MNTSNYSAVPFPSWLESLRSREILEKVRNDPRTTADKILGVSRSIALDSVIGRGQADFDSPWDHLTPYDRVLLYAYFNQRGHLEELVEAFRQLFPDGSPPNKPIVVDIGCGPCTGGLAFAGMCKEFKQFDYIGVDRSEAMRDFGESLAAAAPQMDQSHRQWAITLPKVAWNDAPGWRPVFVIVSYLLASPTLDSVDRLIRDLDGLLTKIGRGRATVIYTNSTNTTPNRRFPEFRDALFEHGFSLFANDKGTIPVERSGETVPRNLRYALFDRPERRILEL